ncbi:hypothetical protein [Cupriavidus agavae]|nr:hypothetical protein [Cupriavidus agavae]
MLLEAAALFVKQDRRRRRGGFEPDIFGRGGGSCGADCHDQANEEPRNRW